MARGIWIVAVACALAAPLAAAAAVRSPSGSLSIEDGRGEVVIRGTGGIIGRIDRGTLQVVDLSPTDRWGAVVNGLPRPRTFTTRGVNINFRLLGGLYRVTIRGTGIAVAARGKGVASLTGEPDEFGLTGLYAAGEDGLSCRAADASCLPLPELTTKVRFGPPEAARLQDRQQ